MDLRDAKGRILDLIIHRRVCTIATIHAALSRWHMRTDIELALLELKLCGAIDELRCSSSRPGINGRRYALACSWAEAASRAGLR